MSEQRMKDRAEASSAGAATPAFGERLDHGRSNHPRWVVPARPAHSQLHRDVDIEDHWWPAQHDALVDAFALIAQGGGPHGFVCPGVGPGPEHCLSSGAVSWAELIT